MPFQRRYLESHIAEDLGQRMVFVGGPRQVGKTTLARLVGEDFKAATYLNWDNRVHRRALLDGHWPLKPSFSFSTKSTNILGGKA
ncbi:MAG: hypothetical protein OXH63_22165 [Gemmatimonadetes bacterium]|nr:hypothetical protein [Gemmatimonadota bacterium]